MVYLDIVLLALHLIATFVIFNKYMFITISWIRFPRLVMHLLTKHLKKENFRKRIEVWEYNFRLLTVIAFPICSLLIQLAIIFKMFCNKFEVEKKRNNCYLSFGPTMLFLIIIHTVLDVFIFSIIKKKAFGSQAPNDKKETENNVEAVKQPESGSTGSIQENV